MALLIVFSDKFIFYLHSHDLITGINVENLSSDRRRAVTGEERTGRAEFFGQDISLQRRVGFIMLEHFAETGDAARGERVDRAGADAVHTDFLRAEIVGQIAR